jgi:hypothetical protein
MHVQFPGREHVYLVGSESGHVYQCSTAYGSDYLGSFGGHCMPVYAVKWNAMHPDVFLSCSADWSIKVSRRVGSGGGRCFWACLRMRRQLGTRKAWQCGKAGSWCGWLA